MLPLRYAATRRDAHCYAAMPLRQRHVMLRLFSRRCCYDMSLRALRCRDYATPRCRRTCDVLILLPLTMPPARFAIVYALHYGAL